MNDTVFHYVVWHCYMGNCPFETDNLYRIKEHLRREHGESPVPVSFKGEILPMRIIPKKKGFI